MSWSFYAIGTVEKLSEALEKESERLTGFSKEEFDAAKPHLVGLLSQNVNVGAVQLEASGHASKKDGKIDYANCSVNIKTLGQILV